MNDAVASRRRVGATFRAVIVVMLGSNLGLLVLSPMLFAEHHRIGVSPRGIESVAIRSNHPRVKHGIAIFYLLGRHLPGATLVVSERFARSNRFKLERVSRLVIEVVPRPPQLDLATAERLAARSIAHRRFAVGKQQRRFELIVDPTETRYVVAETPDDGPLVVLPEALYLAELDKSGMNLRPK